MSAHRTACLHAVVPQLSVELLRHQVRQRLGGAFGDPGDWRPGPGGQLLHGGPFAVLVGDSWDGPELRVGLTAAPDAARLVELLLGDGELRAAGPARAPVADGWAARRPHEVGARLPAGAAGLAQRAWRAALRARGVPDRDCGSLDQDGWARAEFVFDPAGAPALPAGWLARSWSNPVAGRVQSSVRGGPAGRRLVLQSPGLAPVRELDSLLAGWLDAVAAITEPAGC